MAPDGEPAFGGGCVTSLKQSLAAALLVAGASGHAQAAVSASASAAPSVKASELPDPPVIPGDISDRRYVVLGEVSAGVRKFTAFSAAPSQEKIYRELWERGAKKGADAVIHARYGHSHINAISWGQTNATGTAIRFIADGAINR